MEVTLAQGDDAGAIAAMEQILKIDPQQTAVRARLELVRLRRLQALIDDGRRDRIARRYDAARASLNEALALAPGSGAVLHELALTERAAGALDEAETHARGAIAAEPSSADDEATLGAVLADEHKYREGAAAFAKAAALDPRANYSDRAAELRNEADRAALPPEFGDVSHAASVTRAQVAAYIGINLAGLVDKAPKHAVQVATDVRGHWAAPWILSVTQAGILDVYANHTFQPGAVVRRADLARAIAELVTLAGTARPADLTRWRAAHPSFADLPPTHLQYRTAALAVAAGAMAADADGTFQPSRPATGAELSTAVARVQQVAGR
jgi:tetratricopeptide (TPR) repeat protein